jgi:hypothetical protein
VHLFGYPLTINVVGCHQVHHYGCVIKTGTLKDIITGQLRLMGMFVTLGKVDTVDKHDYPTSLFLNINTLVWMDEQNHPCSQFLTKDPTTMNEEIGEMCFSVLARGQKSNPARSSIKQVTKSFIMTRPQMSIAHDFGVELACEDLAGKGIKCSKGNRVLPEAVNDAAEFFKGMLRRFAASQWRPASFELLKQHKTGVDLCTFSKCLDMKMKIKPKPWVVKVTPEDMDRVEKRARDSILHGGKSWVFKPAHSNIWDDFKPEGQDDAKAAPAVPAGRLAPQETEESDDQGDAMVQPPRKRREKKARPLARRKPVAVSQSSESEVEYDGPDGDSDKSEVEAVRKASSGKQRKSTPKKKSQVKRKRNRDQDPPAPNRPPKKRKAGKKTAPSTFYPLRIHGEREMLGSDELQFLIEWRDHPKKKDWSWEPSRTYIEDDDFAWLVQEHFCKRDASRQRFEGSDDEESQSSE